MHFSKMHGLGNDFMVIDAVTQNIRLSSDHIRQFADRRYGVGFDQLLLIEPPYDPDMDFHYRIFNADASEVFQCGNGARCVARFLRMKGLASRAHLSISTKQGKLSLYADEEENICVNMGEPIFEPKSIPFRAMKTESFYLLRFDDHTIMFGAVSMGNPHCVIRVENVETAEVEKIGPWLERHERFPEGVNVGFMEMVQPDHIRLRVYERGAGETLACGSGACAAVAIGIQQGLLTQQVRVDLPGGTLQVSWKGAGSPLWMQGPATHVYDGYLHL